MKSDAARLQTCQNELAILDGMLVNLTNLPAYLWQNQTNSHRVEDIIKTPYLVIPCNHCNQTAYWGAYTMISMGRTQPVIDRINHYRQQVLTSIAYLTPTQVKDDSSHAT